MSKSKVTETEQEIGSDHALIKSMTYGILLSRRQGGEKQ